VSNGSCSLEHQGLQGNRSYPAHLSRRPRHEKGDLSKFIEDAVRWRIFNRTVQEIKSRNAAADPDELQAIIDGAVREVRSERRTKRRANKA
jgi:Ribbon-helix-helix domain